MTIKRLVLTLALSLAAAVPAQAQITATIRATDASTGADVQRVGDDTNDSLRVTIASPATMPVSGTVAATQSGTWTVLPGNTQNSTAWLVTGIGGTFPATQSGTWTVQPGNTANTTAWLVTGTGGTFPATQSGTWAVRAQDGSGNALTSATRGSERALSVQVVDGSGTQITSFGGGGSGATIGSAVPSTGSYTGINVGGNLRGWTGLSLGSHYTATVAIVDASGNQVTSFGGSGGTASNVGSAVPSTATATGQSDGTNMQIPRVFDGDSGAGTQYVQGVSLRKVASGGTVEAGTSSDPLRVDPTGTTTQPVSDAGGSLTVDGTVAATQSGTWNITNVSGTVSLPTGAATAAKQPALGTAGTPSSDVITVQGVTSMTALKVDGSAVTQPVSIAAAVPVTDNSGSLTVDAPVGTPVFVRLSDGSSAIATLPVSLASLPALAAGTANVGLVGRQPTYGSKTTITWTGTSLGGTSARESTVINWTSTRCADARIRIQSKGQASGTNYVDWYVYTALGDTTYTDGATGSDAAFTAANRFNSRYLGSLKMNAATSATQGEFQLSDVFGTMPDKWGLIGINNSGAALSATAGDHVIEYQCVN